MTTETLTRAQMRRAIGAAAAITVQTGSPSFAEDVAAPLAGDVAIRHAAGVVAPAPLSRRAARLAATQPIATPAAQTAPVEDTVIPSVAEGVPEETVTLAAVADAETGPVLVAEVVTGPTATILADSAPVDDATTDAPSDVFEATPTEAPAEPERADDAFDEAVRLFTEAAAVATGPVATRSADTGDSSEARSAADEDQSAEPAAPSGRRRPRRTRAPRGVTPPRPLKSGARRFATVSFTIGAVGAVGMLALATIAPAEAIAAAAKTDPVTSLQAPTQSPEEEAAADIQAFVSPAHTDAGLGREGDTYATATFSDIAAATGISRHTNFFVNDPSGEIQWPFAVGVPISDGYGPRWGGMHNGVDFTPGEGAEIQAVAAGTVRIASESGGAFGVHVMIDHEINGEVFSTHYAHMLYGSLQVQEGQHVEVGQVLGHVGNTGLSYGAHLHFEVYINGSRIDPLPWLREHAGG